MTHKTTRDKKQKEQVVYVKPVLSYDQIVEIIDERIAQIEKAAEEKEVKKKKIKANNNKCK